MALMRPHLSHSDHFWARCSKNIELPKSIQRRALRLVKVHKNKGCEEQLRELRRDLISLYNYLTGGCREERIDLFSWVRSDRT